MYSISGSSGSKIGAVVILRSAPALLKHTLLACKVNSTCTMLCTSGKSVCTPPHVWYLAFLIHHNLFLPMISQPASAGPLVQPRIRRSEDGMHLWWPLEGAMTHATTRQGVFLPENLTPCLWIQTLRGVLLCSFFLTHSNNTLASRGVAQREATGVSGERPCRLGRTCNSIEMGKQSIMDVAAIAAGGLRNTTERCLTSLKSVKVK